MPNQSPEPTPVGAGSSASRFTVIGPAWLSFFRSANKDMRAWLIGCCLFGGLLISGCSTSQRAEQNGELDTATRLSAIEIRLEKVDAKLAVIQAYETGIYVVSPGDTAAAIAQVFSTSLGELERLNPGIQWNRLRVGQRIKIREDVPNKTLQPTATALSVLTGT